MTTKKDPVIGIVVGRFNEFITKNLLAGALSVLKQQHIQPLDPIWVPGAFELPFIAQEIIESHDVDAVICLGCVIRGDTAHFDYVCSEAARGILLTSLETRVPVIFGVLTTETIEQAEERSRLKGGNKGADCALAALDMIEAKRKVLGLKLYA